MLFVSCHSTSKKMVTDHNTGLGFGLAAIPCILFGLLMHFGLFGAVKQSGIADLFTTLSGGVGPMSQMGFVWVGVFLSIFVYIRKFDQTYRKIKEPWTAAGYAIIDSVMLFGVSAGFRSRDAIESTIKKATNAAGSKLRSLGVLGESP